MQLAATKIDPKFQPLKLEITIQTPEELATLWLKLNTPWEIVLQANGKDTLIKQFCQNTVTVRSHENTTKLQDKLSSMVTDYIDKL